jgi:hypothetical protein
MQKYLSYEFDYWAASIRLAEILWRIIWPIAFAFIAIVWVIGMASWKYAAAQFTVEVAIPISTVAVLPEPPIVVAPKKAQGRKPADTAKGKTNSKKVVIQ